MGKEYGYRYFHAGSGCKTGEMVCSICCKKIDEKTQDWVSSMKTTRYDWEYVTRHRACFANQKGWIDIEINKKNMMKMF